MGTSVTLALAAFTKNNLTYAMVTLVPIPTKIFLSLK